MEVLFFLYVCPQVVLLGKSNIALFAWSFTFGHIGGDTFEAVKEEPGCGGFVVSISVSYCYVYKEQCSEHFYAGFVICTCVFSGCAFVRIWYCFVCIWIFIWSHRGEIPLKQSRKNNMLTTPLWRFCCFYIYVCPKVVPLDESNIALFAFRLHLVAEVLSFLYVYQQWSNI